MKKVLYILIAVSLLFSLSACSESEKPEIDIQQISDWISATGYMDDFDYVTDWMIAEGDACDVNISIVVLDGTDPGLALSVADGLVRQVSAAACNQCEDLEGPSGTSYGTFYDYYDALVGVAEQSKVSNNKYWLIYHAIVDEIGPPIELQE